MGRLLPESPRWLLVNKKYGPADAAIRRIAAINRKTLHADFDVTNVKLEVPADQVLKQLYSIGVLCKPFATII